MGLTVCVGGGGEVKVSVSRVFIKKHRSSYKVVLRVFENQTFLA